MFLIFPRGDGTDTYEPSEIKEQNEFYEIQRQYKHTDKYTDKLTRQWLLKEQKEQQNQHQDEHTFKYSHTKDCGMLYCCIGQREA